MRAPGPGRALAAAALACLLAVAFWPAPVYVSTADVLRQPRPLTVSAGRVVSP